MGCPARVGNAGVAVEDLGLVELLLLDEFPQRRHLADLLDAEHLILLVAVDGEAGRVVAAVL